MTCNLEYAALTVAQMQALETERPIVVNSSDGHTTLVNSRALQIAGITAASPGGVDQGPTGATRGYGADAPARPSRGDPS